MRYTLTAAAALVAASMGFEAHAAIGSITVLDSEGKVYSVDTTTAAATKIRDFGDSQPNGGGNDINSPNGLAYNSFTGDFYYTSFEANISGQNEQFFIEGVQDGTVPTSEFANASGTAAGDTYYYVDGIGQLRIATDVDGTRSVSSPISLSPLSGNFRFGDIAVRGDELFLSFDDTLATYNLVSGTTNVISSTLGRFAGIAFDGDILYGVNGAGQPLGLFQIYDTATDMLIDSADRLIAGITGIEGSAQITDAASPVPLPAAAWLLLGGLGGLGLLGRRRARSAA